MKAKILPADPIPVAYPRPESFSAAETGNSPPYGSPMGLEINAVMSTTIDASGTLVANGQPVPVLSVTSDGSTTISVTCSAAHGLSTNAQIATQGLSNALACGFYSITVTTGTAFTYQTLATVPSASLWQASSLMITANVGLPLGQATIAQV